MGPVFDYDASWMIWLVACLVLDFPLLFGAIILWTRRRAHTARNWSMTIGRIVESEVKVIQRRRKVRFSPGIVYEYEADGQTYRGQRVHFGFEMSHNVRSWAAESVAKYPVGQQVEVYYNPEKPADAVLEINAPVGKTVKLAVGIALVSTVAALALALVFLVFQITSRPG